MRLLGVGARTLGRSLLKQLPAGDRAQQSVDYWTTVGRDWAQTLGELRGAAMKLGQLVSQYADVLPPQLAEELRRLQRAAEPLPYAKMARVLDAQWSAAQRAQVVHIEPQALAAASIGQVHRARLNDGRTVVVKIRYPGVGDAVDADLRQLRRIITASKLLPLDGEAMDRVMDEVRERFRDETDYSRELRYLQQMREQAALPSIVYPQPVTALCGAGVLVLSEEIGEPLEVARHWPQAERDHIGEQLLRWLLHQLFTVGAVHADPHPGNFAFRRNGEIVVYDFGCVKPVPDTVVSEVRVLLDAVAARDWIAVHHALERLGGLNGEVPLPAVLPLYRDLERLLVAPLSDPAGFDFADPAFIDDLRASMRAHLGRSFRFKPVTDLVFVLRALSGHYWLLRALGVRIDLNAVMAEQGVRLRDSRRV